MLLKLNNVMLPSDLGEIRKLLDQTEFIDGAASGRASLKNNLQSPQGNPGLEQATQTVLRALGARQEFQAFTLPRQITLIFNRYDSGMFYKDHMDAALMGGLNRQPLRSDLAFTIFLNDPGEYEGGELVIRSPLGEIRVKDVAGNGVVYPATMLHRVETVASGARLAAVGWIQSVVREASQRELLFELESVRRDVMQALPDSPHQERLDRIKENLIRAWAEV